MNMAVLLRAGGEMLQQEHVAALCAARASSPGVDSYFERPLSSPGTRSFTSASRSRLTVCGKQQCRRRLGRRCSRWWSG